MNPLTSVIFAIVSILCTHAVADPITQGNFTLVSRSEDPFFEYFKIFLEAEDTPGVAFAYIVPEPFDYNYQLGGWKIGLY
jgi:hypothetical protein